MSDIRKDFEKWRKSPLLAVYDISTPYKYTEEAIEFTYQAGRAHDAALVVDLAACAYAIEDMFEKAKDDPTAGIDEVDIVKAVLYAAGVPYVER